MARTVAIIGAGQIGFAAFAAFRKAGWEATLHARSRPAWARNDTPWQAWVAGQDPAPNADVVVDCIAFHAVDCARHDPDTVGRLIVISSASVYCDDEGRNLDEAGQRGFPQIPDPITEEQARVTPAETTYSPRKVRLEDATKARFGKRATILRPCAIHGPWSRIPREWWFVKRALDRRSRIPLALLGESRLQTTSARIIGDFCEFAASNELGGAFNLADADSPSVLEIGQVILDQLGSSADLIPFAGANEERIGSTPWSTPAPFVVSGAKAHSAGFTSARSYADEVAPAIDWLTEQARIKPDLVFPDLSLIGEMFDYEGENRLLETL